MAEIKMTIASVAGGAGSGLGGCMKLFLVMVLLGVICCGGAHARELVLYTYHDKPPYYFHADGNGENVLGIYADLAAYLNARQEQYSVRVQFFPRLRLQASLEQGLLDGGVIGVHPPWFQDKEQTRYLWTGPFMFDMDVVVVRKDKPFAYKHPEDLTGKRLSLPRGLYFWGVTELIRQGKIDAEETSSDIQNLQKVALGRADATITSILTYRHLMKHQFCEDELIYLQEPHDRFDRGIFFPKGLEEHYQVINPLLQDILECDAWLGVLEKYDYQGEQH